MHSTRSGEEEEGKKGERVGSCLVVRWDDGDHCDRAGDCERAMVWSIWQEREGGRARAERAGGERTRDQSGVTWEGWHGRIGRQTC